MAPGDLEKVLRALPADKYAKGRILTGSGNNEDAAIVAVPGGMALVQTVDFFTPIINDPYKFGQIAAANSLSDVYAMGGTPWCCMNIVCFPAKMASMDILADILRGGADKIAEAGAALAGGHSVEDDEIKYGLSVTGLVPPDSFASNGGMRKGDVLLCTKALGTGILATGIKGEHPDSALMEEDLYLTASRLNRVPGEVIRTLGLKAATDITGFGLGGHLIEMLQASGCKAEITAGGINFLPRALELAGEGYVPAGSHANRRHKEGRFKVEEGVDPIMTDLVFDAQTSGGMILSAPEDRADEALKLLREGGELAAVIGRVTGECQTGAAGGPILVIRP